MPENRHVTEAELNLVTEKIDSAVKDVKKEVRWLLVVGLAGSQLIHNIDIPSSVSTAGSVTAVSLVVGKVVSSFFFAR